MSHELLIVPLPPRLNKHARLVRDARIDRRNRTAPQRRVLILGLHGGSTVTRRVTLYAFIGYCLLVFTGILALRVLLLVFRSAQADRAR